MPPKGWKAPEPKLLDARRLFALYAPEEDDIALGVKLGVGRKKVAHWKKTEDHWISSYYADKIAIRLGTHPAVIWGRDWWATAADEAELYDTAE